MANKRKNKKNNQEIFSQEVKLRIIMIVLVFLVLLSALKLGLIGNYLNYFFTYMFGNFTLVILLVLTVLFSYIFYCAKLPKFSGPKAVGIYLILVGSITLFSSTSKITGISNIQTYINNPSLKEGGLIGAILYGVFSTLFANTGTIIACVAIIIIGLILLAGKSYFEYKKAIKNRYSNHKQSKSQKNASNFTDFFTKGKNKKVPLFDEDVFEDSPDTETIIHQIEEEDDDIPTKFEFNEDSLALDIKDKELPKTSSETTKPKTVKRNKNYTLPPMTLLTKMSANKKSTDNKNNAVENADRLTGVLKQFGVNATISDIFIGPTVTKYELKLEVGTRVNKIMQLQDDIKLALASKDIRIEAPIPGKPAVGVEVPNKDAGVVTFKEVFKDIPKKYDSNKLAIPLGKDISGKLIVAELDKMPHLLIAGATGSGKSVCVNTIISSILMRAKPDEVKLLLVDPKKVELSNYNGIPHLLAPVVTDPKKAAATLHEVVQEMENRYDLFAEANVRNITTYNEYVENSEPEENLEKIPYIVIILDEVADLMMVASKDVEECIMRLAQMARAAGIHMIVATQRPSTDIITGVIKANIPSRIAFAVSSSIDSRTILDTTGAEKLLGKGDMLFSPMGATSPIRVQGAFVSDKEVEDITYHCMNQQEAQYEDRFENVKPSTSGAGNGSSDDLDEEYEDCRAFVIQEQKASTSLLQRHFRIGYNKAARIIDQLEENGVIGPQMGSKPREVYIRGYQEEDF